MNPWVMLGLEVAKAIAEAKGRKAEKMGGTVAEVVESYLKVDALFDRMEEAARTGQPATFTTEECAELAEIRDDMQAFFARFKVKLKRD